MINVDATRLKQAYRLAAYIAHTRNVGCLTDDLYSRGLEEIAKNPSVMPSELCYRMRDEIKSILGKPGSDRAGAVALSGLTPKQAANPEDVVGARLFLQKLGERLGPTQKKIFNLLARGYIQREIATLLGVNESFVTKSVHKIKHHAKTMQMQEEVTI